MTTAPVSDLNRPGAILLVEDEDMRASLAVLLEEAGFRVLEADDGLDASAHLSADTPIAMIVLDLQLPRLTGWEFRERQLSPDEIRWLAAKTVLTKPFLFDDVLRSAQANGGPPA